MVKIAQHISNLLYCHDCVILPEFGGFVANYKPAEIDKFTKTISPPSKNISFNKFLSHNDGLLINEVSTKENLDYKKAESVVSDYINFCKTTLNEEKRLEIENIGLFYLQDKHIHFKPNKDNYLTSSFGFSPVSFTKIEAQVEKVPQEIISEEKPLKRKIEEPKENRVIVPSKEKKEDKSKITFPRYILTSLALLILFYTAWIPLKTDVLKSGQIEVSDLNPFSFDKCPTAYSSSKFYSNTTLKSISEENSKETLSIEDRKIVVLDEYPPKENIAESTHVETEVKKTSWKRTYYVVAGCFKEKDNALNLVEKLKEEGYKAELIDKHKGLHRVAFSKFPSRRKAKKLFDKIREEGLSVWILKK